MKNLIQTGFISLLLLVLISHIFQNTQKLQKKDYHKHAYLKITNFDAKSVLFTDYR